MKLVLVNIVMSKKDVMRIINIIGEEKVYLETAKKRDRKKIRQDYYINKEIELIKLEEKLLYFLNNESFVV